MTASKILIVDDEPKMQRILEIMLQQMGHAALLAGNGREALDIVQAQSVDLIVSDLQMPVMNGLEMLKTLRARDIATPCIIITAHGAVETAVEAMKHGASDYIIRPFDVNALELAINRALALGRMRRENDYLRQEVDKGWGEFVGRGPAMRQVYELIEQVAPGKTNVLIVGETGTGKELVARAIHRASPRRDALFVPINCAAIPGDLLESEMFGYVKGAFTGAMKDKLGKFEMAQGGTLFLDEITEMNPLLQAKLLRTLQENRLERLGSNDSIELDARIVAATNRDPLEAVRAGKLREDLYYRVQVFAIRLPPLRERPEDIPLLAEHFLQKLGFKLGMASPGIAPDAVARMQAYRWPGNVREMENVMERALVLSRGQEIDSRRLPQEIAGLAVAPPVPAAPESAEDEEPENLNLEPAVESLECRYIRLALARSGNNKTKAARLLEISERTLWYKLKKYELG
jgi:two-component system response regulator AtoC